MVTKLTPVEASIIRLALRDYAKRLPVTQDSSITFNRGDCYKLVDRLENFNRMEITSW